VEFYQNLTLVNGEMLRIMPRQGALPHLNKDYSLQPHSVIKELNFKY
jgi:hypothetical protein